MHADAAAPNRIQMSGAGADAPQPPLPGQAQATEQGGLVRVLPIVNHKGLHARASAKFVQCVEAFDATIKVTRGGETVGGLSIMGLMMLAAARGTEITVEATGRDAQAAMDAVEALVASKFGEEC